MRLILDIGAADGATIGYRLHTLGRCVGLDINENLVRKGHGHAIPGACFLAASAERLPFRDGVFDMVVSEHVIEHVEDLDLCLEEMKRVLKAGGELRLSFPGARVDAFIGRISPDYFSPRFHKRLIHVHALERSLADRCFDVVHVSKNQSFRAIKNIYKFWSGHEIEDQTGKVQKKDVVLSILEVLWVVFEFKYDKIVWHLRENKSMWMLSIIYFFKVVLFPVSLVFLLLNTVIPANVDVIAVKKA